MERKDLRLNIHYAMLHITYWCVMAAATLYVVPLLRAKGLTESQIGVTLSVKYVASILAQIGISYFADRYQRVVTLKRILIALCMLCLPMTLYFYFSRGSFLKAIAMLAFFGGCVNGATAYINAIATRFTDAGRTVYYSYARGLGSIAWGVASVVISYIVDNSHVEVILIVQAVMTVGMMIVVWTLEPVPVTQREEKAENKDVSHSYGYLFRHHPGFDCFLLSSILLFTGYTLQTVFLVDIITHVGGGNPELGYVEMVQSICELLPAVLYVMIAKKLSTANILRLSAISSFLMIFCVMISKNIGHVLLLQVFDILGFGMYWPVSVEYVYQTIEKNDWTKGQALISAFSLGAGGIIGSLFGGTVMQFAGIEGLLRISSVLALIGVVFMMIAMKLSEKKINAERGEMML